MKATMRRITVVTCALCVVTILANQDRAAAAEADAPLPQVQTRDEQFENQEQRIRNLEKRLQEMESGSMAGTGKKEAAAAQPSAEAKDSAEVPSHLDVTAGEYREPHLVDTGASLASAEFPGSWPMFGSDYRMKFGGYFKADALYDFNGSGNKTQFTMAGIPVNGTPSANRSGYFNLFARETRFNFDVRKSLPGELPQKVFIEMDFFGGDNQSNPRLRHAYVQYGNLLVGQTWSILTDLRAINFMIDFAYGDAIFGGRTKQVRWQQQVDKHWSYAVGVENLDFTGIDSQGLTGAASPNLPVLAGRVAYEGRSTLLVLGGLAQRLRWDREGAGPNATATGWAIMTSGRRNLGEGDYAAWQFSYGDGAIENITALTGRNANATLFPNGHLETNRAVNVSLSYTHNITEVLSTNLNYAVMKVESDHQRTPDSLKRAQIAHVNLIWRVTKAMRTGIEYMWGESENSSGATGHSSRVQTMLMYTF